MSVVVATMFYQDSVDVLRHVHPLWQAGSKPKCRVLGMKFGLILALDAKRHGRAHSAGLPLVMKRDNTDTAKIEKEVDVFRALH